MSIDQTAFFSAPQPSDEGSVDVVLIGGGIMSATMGTLLKAVEPGCRIQIFERLDGVALESSAVVNNAGTGHAGNCELNYTPMTPDGDINISKACRINASFENSLQLWASMVAEGWIQDASQIVNPIPHMSFVEGEEDVTFLRARHRAMASHPFFKEMDFSTDAGRIREWAPLVMTGRTDKKPVAATRVARGTDVNFGQITKAMFNHLKRQEGVELSLGVEATQIKRLKDRRWLVKTKRMDTGYVNTLRARFVFIGAGGQALPLLMSSGIPESRGYGGFPVSGMWLWCRNQEVAARHSAKVYGKAQLGAPPMSVPHLDTRMLHGKRQLLFGPFAGFSTKFLKNGSALDLFSSLRPGNILPMTAAGIKNMSLTSYLIGQVLQSPKQRIEMLRGYFPEARDEDWKLKVAGQRVQIIKRTQDTLGKIQFGTETIVSKDRSLAALLGASPGASTSAAIVLDLLATCFRNESQSDKWRSALTRLIPSFGLSLEDDQDAFKRLRSRADEILGMGEDGV